MTAEHDRLLEIYLADHAAAATAGAALAQRAAQNNSKNEYGDFLRGMSAAIEEDRRSLQQIIAQLGFRESRSKEAVAWLAEKVGRLKLNGRLWEYSPLSRVLELEALSVGVAGKLALWESLQARTDIGGRLSGPDLDVLAARARQQRAEVEQHRLQAAREAFGPGGGSWSRHGRSTHGGGA